MGLEEREDLLMRQIRAVGVMLARILGFRVAGAHEEAAGELERAYSELLGPGPALIRDVDSATAALLVRDPDKLALLAALTQEEARLLRAQGNDAAHLEARALDLARAALDRDGRNPIAMRVVEEQGR